jgi:hypothetical protein
MLEALREQLTMGGGGIWKECEVMSAAQPKFLQKLGFLESNWSPIRLYFSSGF